MSPYRDMATGYARRYNIPPALLHALIQQESGWNPNARSPVGASGLTQVMPDTARQPGYGVDPLLDPRDPQENLRFGAEYLAAMLRNYDGDHIRALAAYNWGPGNADNWSGDMGDLPAETRGYINNIYAGLEDDYGTGPTRARAEAGLPLVRTDRRGEYGYRHPQGVGIHQEADGDEGTLSADQVKAKQADRAFRLMQHGLGIMNRGFF